jgi:hypothetical protein
LPIPGRLDALNDALEALDPAESVSGLQQMYPSAKQLVAASAVVQGATNGGASAVADVYHSTLVPPFCLAAAISFFAAR